MKNDQYTAFKTSKNNLTKKLVEIGQKITDKQI